MSIYKRAHPRTFADLPVRFRLPDGKTIDATTANLSLAGFQVAADRHTVDVLFPITLTPNPHQRVEVTAELHIPARAGEAVVGTARTSGVFARRVAVERYRVGFEFTHIDPDVEAALGEFVGVH